MLWLTTHIYFFFMLAISLCPSWIQMPTEAKDICLTNFKCLMYRSLTLTDYILTKSLVCHSKPAVSIALSRKLFSIWWYKIANTVLDNQHDKTLWLTFPVKTDTCKASMTAEIAWPLLTLKQAMVIAEGVWPNKVSQETTEQLGSRIKKNIV